MLTAEGTRPSARAAAEKEPWSSTARKSCTLSEEKAKDNPDAVRKLMKRLVKETAAAGVPRAICGHRPVLPLMLEALGVPDRPMLTAAVLVAHLSPDGGTVSVEWHKPRV